MHKSRKKNKKQFETEHEEGGREGGTNNWGEKNERWFKELEGGEGGIFYDQLILF